MKSLLWNLARTSVLLVTAWLATAAVAGADAGSDDPPTSLAEALTRGEAIVSLRFHYEVVNQDGFDRDAEAPTLRTTLSYGSLKYKGFRFLVEAENVAVIGSDYYNNAGAGSANNGVRDRPVVADPELTSVSQAYVEMDVAKARFRLGRQQINRGNQRFVGSVAWRQHHQSFDAIAISSHSLERLSLTYHYLNKVHRIFGDSRDMNSHLLDAEIKIGDRDRLTAYGYVLDYERPEDVGLSTSTYGLRWAGHVPMGASRFGYALEAARQSDTGDNPRDIDAEYLLAELTAGSKAFTGTVGYEVLSGSARDGAFSTPLATLHKFNGWADKFLRTPTTGLVDLYAGLSGSLGRFSWKAVYHDFQPESGDGADYGTELDLQAIYKTSRGLVLGFKAALYDAEAHATDTDKFMIWAAYKFGRKN